MYYRMSCPRCRQRIEYTDMQVGYLMHCKRCNREVLLRGNPMRVTMYLLWAATFVFMAYGGMRLYRYVQREGRYSSEMVAPETTQATLNT